MSSLLEWPPGVVWEREWKHEAHASSLRAWPLGALRVKVWRR